MGELLHSLVAHVATLPVELLYLVIGAGAAVENIIPPVPADTFVLLGAFLAGLGRASAWLVFLVTWLCNVASAMGVYGLSRRHGPGFFESRVGRWILHPGQLEQISRFYFRWGIIAIFASRFLPGLRAVVPVFAGVGKLGAWRVVVPLAGASALWYGFLVYMGTAAGRNWPALVRFLDRISGVLLWLVLPILALLVIWWLRTRRRHR